MQYEYEASLLSQLVAIHTAGRNPAAWQPVVKQYICNVPAGEVQCMDPKMLAIVCDFLKDVICKSPRDIICLFLTSAALVLMPVQASNLRRSWLITPCARWKTWTVPFCCLP